MRKLPFALVLIVAGALAACAGQRYNGDLFRAQINAPYQLASGDRLRVIVFGQDSLTNSFSVDGAGNISMPLIGLVKAYGLTSAELERAIAARLRNGYLRDPRVSVEVEAFRPFFVLGEVQTAGQYPFINSMTVQNAVAVAGGFSPRGYQAGADVTRMINGRPVTAFVPLTFQVRPGDTVTVRERFF
ncbi:MAG TPA: polysaccharide biosynthesis/export family protein [Roseiarcus sp.]|jgi:polysaccharide export outer membrane protein|nr:polysaccharide biosynthesis/export family protein [Roseiarcus sp.]